jgi:hypothetical protein
MTFLDDDFLTRVDLLATKNKNAISSRYAGKANGVIKQPCQELNAGVSRNCEMKCTQDRRCLTKHKSHYHRQLLQGQSLGTSGKSFSFIVRACKEPTPSVQASREEA